MKVKILITFLLIYCQISFSQTIKGKISFNNYAIANAEIVNTKTKTIATSDGNGLFTIDAKPNETIVFIAKGYDLKSILITSKLIKENNLMINLVLKAEELKEVVINNQPSIKLGSDTKWEQGKLDQYTLEKNAQRLKVAGVSSHTIENGMDFVRIGKLIGSLFKKEKDSEQPKKNNSLATFKTIAKNSCDQRFFLETLKLKPEQIDLFLQFCENDPKSNALLQDSNDLAVMEFLLNKNNEFKKL
ncbi:MAG: carboxypeptidase-like regulatory domain-containing protein [Flavobacteriaceae bacterium]|nr:carboxypeptidase-like regulatory domain-containing protein [Flavobacteriaceae bacterium]